MAAQLFTFLRRDPAVAQALRTAAESEKGNTKADLLALADGLEAGSLSPATRSLLADEGLAGRVQSILADADWGSEPLRDRLAKLFGDLSELGVDDISATRWISSELAASAFTTIFIVAGLFGITAGLVLIFLIFVMLAAERKSEMGMARAVGAQRGHLVEMFVFEGTAYDLAAAAVGVALGVVTGLIIAVTLGQAFAGVGLTIRPNISLRSLVVSYSLGMLVTFVTVLFSANRVSHLNIVSAIRDLPEPPRPPSYLRDRLLAPFRVVADGFRALFHLRLFRALRAWLIGLPGSLLRLVWMGFTSGPFTLLLGLFLTPVGIQNANAAAYSMGVSFVIIGGGLMLRGLLRTAVPAACPRPGLEHRRSAGPDRIYAVGAGADGFLVAAQPVPARHLRGAGHERRTGDALHLRHPDRRRGSAGDHVQHRPAAAPDPAGPGRLAAFCPGAAHGHRLSAVEPLPHRDDDRHLRRRHVQRDFHGDAVQSE